MPKRRDTLLLLIGRRHSGNRATKIETRVLAYFGMMLVLIGLAGGLYLHEASVVASYARDIRVLEAEKEKLHRDIVASRAEVAELGSLSRVLLLGETLGYDVPTATDHDRRLWLTYSLPESDAASVAAGRRTMGTGAEQNPPEPGMLSDLTQQFRQWMNAPVDGSDDG